MDDQLRHGTDAPSIGIILRKAKNEVIVEYTLRDSAKPKGVAEYRLSTAFSEPLRAELPTVAELARALPPLSLLSLRIEIEGEPRIMADEHGLHERPPPVEAALAELERSGRAPSNRSRRHRRS